MLSFLNSITATANCKTRPTDETSRGTPSEDTSADNSQPFCNGSTDAKKTRKGKQPISADKITTAAVSAMTGPSAKLQPIGIIIPQTLDETKEEGIRGIPNMDSPLFKDIPRKKIESSSDSSSSSTSGENSSSVSTSSEESDNEEEQNKDAEFNNTSTELDKPEEPLKPRIPIKLTISNLDRSLLKAPLSSSSASSTRNISNNMNRCEVDTDSKNSEMTMELQVDSVDATKTTKDSGVNTYQHHRINEEAAFSKQQVKSTSSRPLDNGHPSNNSQDKNQYHCSNAVDVTLKDIDLFCSSSFSLKKSDYSVRNSQMVNSLDPTTKENDACKVNEDTGSFDYTSKEELQPLGIYQEKEDIENLQQRNEILSKERGSLVKPLPVSLKILPGSVRSLKVSKGLSPVIEGPLSITTELESAEEQLAKSDDSPLLEERFRIKNYQDVSILASALCEVRKNTKATDVSASEELSSGLSIESQNAISENKSSLEAVPVCTTDVQNSAESDNMQKMCNANNRTLQNDCKLNISKNIISSQTCGKQNKNLENDNTLKVLLAEQIDISDVKDETLDMNDINFNDKNAGKYLSTKTDQELLQTFDKKVTTQTEPSCSKDSVVSTQSVIGDASTKITSVTTSIANSSSKNSTGGNNTATCGSTLGVPDSKNPFITWTNYDDDRSLNVNATLPGSLVRVPFPHLPLPGDSPIAHISSLGVAVSLLSPVGLAAASSGNGHLIIPSPGRRPTQDTSADGHGLRSSPSNNTTKQQTSLPDLQIGHTGSSSSSQATHGKAKTSHKSGKRTSRLSNIIDSLRTSKEMQAAGSSEISSQHKKKRAAELMFERNSPSYESSSAAGHRPSSSSSSTSSSSASSPLFSGSLGSDYRSSGEKLHHEDTGYSHQTSLDPRQLMRANLDAARVPPDHTSFSVPRSDTNKGKRMLENLEMMNNGLLDAYSKTGTSDSKSHKLNNPHSHSHSRLLSSASATASLGQVLVSRPSSRLSSKSSNPAYTSASSSIRTSSAVTTSSSGANSGNNSNMFQVAPLAASHMDLNTANMLTYQHLYGMQDPYLMKTLMSNPLYLQRMMEYQKHAMDPLMLQQLEMYEMLAAMEANKNGTDQASLNAQSILWQAHAAAMIQQQQMQQFQQLQLQQQQLQQQAAAARDRKTRETIAAIMANKSGNFSANTNKSVGSISTGQLAKSIMASSSSSSSTPTHSLTSSKRTRPAFSSSSSDIYSRDVPSQEKKQRHSHQTFSHLPNQTSSSSSTPTSSLLKPSQTTTKPTGGSNIKASSGSITYTQPKQDLLGLSAAFQVPQTSSPHLWGFPTFLQPSSLDMNHMAHFFERPGDSSLSSLAHVSGDQEPTGVDVLDLSVKPGGDKT